MAPPKIGAKTLPADFIKMKRDRQRIAIVTAYDAPSAQLAAAAGLNGVLVGDSAATTVLGYESTVRIGLPEMLVFTRAVARAAERLLVIADMPFGSFQPSNAAAVRNAVRLVRSGADAVKLEGAGAAAARVAAIRGAGVPVVGHIGLTPQSAVALGGYRAQGRTARVARQLLEDARKLEDAGCFALVIEAVPPEVAARITDAAEIPTIGIGAGVECDGQVLVWHDLLGLSAGRVPRFVKRYADLSEIIVRALKAYAADVREGRFPAAEHTYSMAAGELERFESQKGATSATEMEPSRKPRGA
jgi:3-methyl-2-oxobutanoate hydroxymethyltransferase